MNWKFIFIFIFLFSFAKTDIKAYDCPDRFVNFVNPVRSRSLWIDNSLKPIVVQKEMLDKFGFTGTWLIQYDVLNDRELVEELKTYKNDEVGVFLEISIDLATDSKVNYLLNTPWYSPNVVFLSGYERGERIKLIDHLFSKFNKEFGYFPKSVGAWWIDSFSLNYMKDKYGINSALIVADQKTTDSYGIWGQWWGYPYVSSKYNILDPAKTDSSQVVIIQWAQRHPHLAYIGFGPQTSNYSIQANDYKSLGLNTDFFKETVSYYLDCKNDIGQITMGMETGMEGLSFIDEYEKQIEYLSSISVKDLTMSDFANLYKDKYKQNDSTIVIGQTDKEWKLTKNQRQNLFLEDQISYTGYVFKDYFVADDSQFLDRDLSKIDKSGNNMIYIPLYLIVLLIFTVILIKRKVNKIRLATIILSVLISHILVYRSYCFRNWCVFFSFESNLLMYYQMFLSVIFYVLFFLISNKINLFFYLASFGLLGLINILRYTVIDGIKYFGVLIGWDRLIGIGVSENRLLFINKEFEQFTSALIKVDLNFIYSNKYFYILLLPLSNLLLAIILTKLWKINKFWRVCTGILFVFGIVYLFQLSQMAPEAVLPIN